MKRADLPWRSAVIALSILASASVSAGPFTTVRGFGTLGGVITDSDDDVYILDNQRDGADSSGSFENDTRVGVQFDTRITERHSGTVQVLGRQGEEGRFEPGVEWAFLRTRLDDTFTLRLGRIGAPFFNVSDFRDVGYANTALRPPQDTYGQIPFRSVDGFDLTAHVPVGDVIVNAQLFTGEARITFPFDLAISGKDVVGTNASVEIGPARLRLGYTTARIAVQSPGFDQLVAGLAGLSRAAPPLAPALEPVIAEFDTEADRGSFAGVGLDLDLDPLQLSLEYTRRRIDRMNANTTGWHALVAWREGAVTPYAYLSALSHDTVVDASVLSSDPALAPLAAGVEHVLGSVAQRSRAVGLRWDFADGLALKGQYEHIERERDGNNFIVDTPTFADGEDIDLYSLGIDFVF